MSKVNGGYHTPDGRTEGMRLVLSPPAGLLPWRLRNIRGYYTDDSQGETITPCLVRLTHGRVMPGATMGEGMATWWQEEGIVTISDENDERDAWYAAIALAERLAEDEREYQATICRECWEHPRCPESGDDQQCASCHAAALAEEGAPVVFIGVTVTGTMAGGVNLHA